MPIVLDRTQAEIQPLYISICCGWCRPVITQIVRRGNSLALRIPSVLAQTLMIGEGSSVRLTMDNGRLVVSPVVEEAVYCVANLAPGISDDNNYSAVDFGRPVGSEVW